MSPDEITVVLLKRLDVAPRKILQLQRSIARKQPDSKGRLKAIEKLEKFAAQTDRRQQALRKIQYSHRICKPDLLRNATNT